MKNIAAFLDHTMIKPDASEEDVFRSCREAVEYGCHSLCVLPWYIRSAYTELKESDVDICTGIGFPLGANLLSTKLHESEKALADGAAELDMTINIGAVKSGRLDVIEKEIREVRRLCGAERVLKIIIETAYLTEEEKKRVSVISRDAGADYIKTSTGTAATGATVQDVRLIRQTVGDFPKIKAAGGIDSYAFALELIQAGASRLGTSRPGIIIKESLEV